MTAIATGSSEPLGMYKLDGYQITEAFKFLNESGEIAVDDMAGLEFRYIEVLDQEEGSIPNLEHQIEDHPEMFVQAIALAFRRDDDAEDPLELRPANAESREQQAMAAYRLLEKLSRIPGHNRQGDLEAARILEWLNRVRVACSELARGDVCDIQLGKLLSKAPVDSDGVWPCEPVREAIESLPTEKLCDGILNGLMNSRGAHWRARGEGGEQERQLAAQYAAWARALEFKYPRVTKILKEMVRTYEHQANREDTESSIRKRLLD
jgi:hypothetical protein